MTSHDVVVRLIEPDDFAAVSRLTVAAYRADGQLDEDHGYGAVLADVVSRAEAAEVLVAVDGAAVLGAVTFVLPGTKYAEVSGDDEAEFRMLAVDPAAQRRGVARRLVRACVDRAQALGCTSLTICVREGNAAAFALYDQFGFARDPSLDWSPAPGVDLLGMRLPLQVLAQ
ncbi:GNAT family N-acetyltransferase [Dactylosporangium fulvum]|uniref:GNAT family N-acetyltransferase n=1 Tax=Dactylosporangium fulvum TaxID=53359 RepID=A0ABY5W2P9_9ACTN|nr:N-acetyltransferase [Dactylosporangium fulvum]UWP83787.1 GNAT family N-acetyltransferase [Dactylosporangium fulvum]